MPILALRFRSFDIFFGANQPGPWFAFVAGKLLKKPYVIYLAQPLRLLHPRDIDRENGIRIREGDHQFLMLLRKTAGQLINIADRASVSEASRILTNGHYVGSWIEDIYGVQTIDCPAGCHPMEVRNSTFLTKWMGSLDVGDVEIPRPYILLTNRHSTMKRFEYALWALKTIVRLQPDIRLVITGQETSYTDQLKHLTSSLRLEGNVMFVGRVTEKDLARLYRYAAAYVYPSPEEDFGMGIVEAMGAGVPVVAWNIGVPTVTVSHRQTGFLAQPYDTYEFADHLFTLLTNKKLNQKMGEAGHRRASRLFSYSLHNQILEGNLRAAYQAHTLVRRVETETIVRNHLLRSPVGERSLRSTLSRRFYLEAELADEISEPTPEEEPYR